MPAPLFQDFVVPAALAGARLDRAVATLSNCSRRLARLAIAEGRVQVGSRCVRIFTREVRAGQRLRLAAVQAEGADGAMAALGDNGAPPRVAAPVQVDFPAACGAAPVNQPSAPATLQVVYLDPWLVVVNKPAGLLSEPDRFGAPSVEGLLPGVLRARGERDEVWLVHRLDAGTSGLLAFARRRSAARRLFAAFAERRVHKTYWAVVAGALPGPAHATGAIARVAGTRHGVRADGRPADTRFVPLAAAGAYGLVDARPTTGRTHQIRVHLAELGHPIVGDALYGGPRYVRSPGSAAPGDFTRAVRRPMLHARALQLPHPAEDDGKTLALEAPLATDMAALCQALALGPPGEA